ncbi:MAG: serine/threonine protein kinase, partial [Actinomycetota bacterium]|nr:serine/threonine protein kinase [Actinomycetota bacterium]
MSASDEGRCVADRYELGELLGRGGMGAVWRAQDLVLQRPVAVKEIAFPPSIPAAEREALRNRLMREARAAARLSHPSVTTVFDIVVEDETPYLVMELVEAPTLTDLVRSDGPLEPRRAAAIGLEVLGALEVAHRAGIVHRDVKPGNIMVPGSGPAKLADFGIASLADDSNITTTGSVLGSPSFIAPEQANSSTSGPAADLWGLGASLYFAVEGIGPFERGQALPTLSAVLRDPPRPMQQAGALAPAIEALLVKDPDQRADAAETRRLLSGVAGGGVAPAAT